MVTVCAILSVFMVQSADAFSVIRSTPRMGIPVVGRFFRSRKTAGPAVLTAPPVIPEPIQVGDSLPHIELNLSANGDANGNAFADEALSTGTSLLVGLSNDGAADLSVYLKAFPNLIRAGVDRTVFVVSPSSDDTTEQQHSGLPTDVSVAVDQDSEWFRACGLMDGEQPTPFALLCKDGVVADLVAGVHADLSPTAIMRAFSLEVPSTAVAGSADDVEISEEAGVASLIGLGVLAVLSSSSWPGTDGQQASPPALPAIERAAPTTVAPKLEATGSLLKLYR